MNREENNNPILPNLQTVPMDVNAGENRFADFEDYTVYPSPYVVVNHHGYTKHYYADAERICSTGLLGLHDSPVDNDVVSTQVKENYQSIERDLSCAGAKAETRKLRFDVFDILAGNIVTEKKTSFYHPDHLGSASWITDHESNSIQHMQYLPYEETKLDQRISSYSERYTFSGKEKDSETGYHYFGARYYNSDLSLWLSVDPMSDKYPSLSPYNYCAWNPMKLVDPDGMIIDSASITENIKTILNNNTEFKKAFETLSNDKDNVYSFNVWDSPHIENGRRIDGNIIYDGEKVSINHVEMSDNFALFEEVAHALQYYEWDIGFANTLNENGVLQWGTFGLDCNDEINAKEWAAKMANRSKIRYIVDDLRNDKYDVNRLGVESRTAYNEYKNYLNNNPKIKESSYNSRGWIIHSYIHFRKKE